MEKKIHTAIFVSVLVLALPGLALAEPPASKIFVTHLDGGQEVPARETLATGQFTSKLNDDETELSYRLIVANIENVVAAIMQVVAGAADRAQRGVAGDHA